MFFETAMHVVAVRYNKESIIGNVVYFESGGIGANEEP